MIQTGAEKTLQAPDWGKLVDEVAAFITIDEMLHQGHLTDDRFNQLRHDPRFSSIIHNALAFSVARYESADPHAAELSEAALTGAMFVVESINQAMQMAHTASDDNPISEEYTVTASGGGASDLPPAA